MLTRHFTDKQASSLQDYVELSVMLESIIVKINYEMRQLCSYDC